MIYLQIGEIRIYILIKKYMKILIIGASGYLGSKLYMDLKKTYKVIGTYYTNKLFNDLFFLDITSKKDVNYFINLHKPDAIIHTSANTSSTWCEDNKLNAILLNETATKYIVEAANNIGAKVIYFSSFAVMKSKNIYALTKKNSEKIVTHTKNRYAILRLSVLVGQSPNKLSNVFYNKIFRLISEKKLLELDASWKFQISHISHVSDVVQEILKNNKYHGIIPVATKITKSKYEIISDVLPKMTNDIIKVFSNRKPETPVSINRLKKYHFPIYSYNKIKKILFEEFKQAYMFNTDKICNMIIN